MAEIRKNFERSESLARLPLAEAVGMRIDKIRDSLHRRTPEPFRPLVARLLRMRSDEFTLTQPIDSTNRPERPCLVAHEAVNLHPPDKQLSFIPRIENRIGLSIPVSEKKIGSTEQQPWYYQGKEPSCMAFACANAMRALGIIPSERAIQTLRKSANREAAASLGSGSRIDLMSARANKLIEDATVIEVAEENRLLAGCKRVDNVWSRTETFQLVCQQNAEKIKKTIDSGEVLVQLVVNNRYLANATGSEPKHWIAIVGYKIDEQGLANFDIIDSARGRYQAGIEKLTFSVPLLSENQRHSFTVRKKV
ncbi:MAG: hypothetical protein WCP97_07210 [bacterium]